MFITRATNGGEASEDNRNWWELFNLPDGTIPQCGPLQFIAYFYLRGRAPISQTSISRAELDSYLDRYQGVRIYRDGFRVKPYGDPDSNADNDWLGLNMRKVRNPAGIGRPTWVVSANQVVGGIFISRSANPNLRDQTNREGLINNEAYRDLGKFALSGLSFLERVRYEINPKSNGQGELDVRERISETQEELADTSKQIREMVNEPAIKHKMEQETAEKLATIAEHIDSVTVQLAGAEQIIADRPG